MRSELTARGGGKGGCENGLDLDNDDSESWSSGPLLQKEAAGQPLSPSMAGFNRVLPFSIDPLTPFLESNASVPHRLVPPQYHDLHKRYNSNL